MKVKDFVKLEFEKIGFTSPICINREFESDMFLKCR